MKEGLIIIDFNRTLYDPDRQSLFEGVREFLADYTKAYALALIGKGDDKRASLIQDLGIQHYFSYLKLKEEKEESDFLECMRTLGFGKERVWSIGDRIRKEIVLSNRAGIRTIWFQNGKFAHETPATPEEQPTFIIHSFKEIRDIVPL